MLQTIENTKGEDFMIIQLGIDSVNRGIAY